MYVCMSVWLWAGLSGVAADAVCSFIAWILWEAVLFMASYAWQYACEGAYMKLLQLQQQQCKVVALKLFLSALNLQ